jgi:mono/diheme cytochrome c family protein
MRLDAPEIAMRRFFCSWLLFSWMTVPAMAVAEETSPAAEGVTFFTEQIEPIFARHCYKCHGNGEAKGGLSFYTRESLMQGGDSGVPVDLEKPAASLMLEALNYESYEMPPDGQLPREQIDLIAKWIELGAPMPVRTDAREVHDDGPPPINEQTRNHWSFRPLQRPEVPEVDDPDWSRNPIDAFLFARLQEQGLRPNPPADRRTLIRRLHYNLLGLPPTPEEVEAFVSDPSPDAYENLVDRLLDSPHYGEHWARYWLDVVRYAESNSFERDNPKPFVWRFRDYVVRAFNEDKPYDRILLEQLAGDELPEVTRDSVIATGFYRLGPWDDEPADPKLALYDELDDIITTTAQGFLGLTLNCARCHDHKLDPVTQADYYRFLAFFRNVKRYGIRSDQSVHERSVRSIATPEEKRRLAKEIEEYEENVRMLRQQLDVVEEWIQKHLVAGEKDDFQNDSVRQEIIRKYIGEHITEEEFNEYAETRQRWSNLRNRPPRSAEQALCIKEHGPDPPSTHVLIRGNPGAEGDVVEPAFPEILSPPEPEIVPPEHEESSGRRLALAKWIASPENPLTARVMANRIWQWHFGRGLVRTPNDFGLQGDRPTHPELLDWLAAEFIERGWSIKQMHRLILLSNAYRMSSGRTERPPDEQRPHPGLSADPQNNLFWRFDMRRLRAEEIRDSILAVNGSLNREKMYGPSMYPEIPQAVLAGQSMPGHNWHTSIPEEQDRRSIYIHVKRSLTVPLLAAFDVPETEFTCPARFATTQPTQALGMLNSEFLNRQARVFADEVSHLADDTAARVRLALERTLQRPPHEQEVTRGVELIESLQRDHGQSAEQALKNFCLLALNLNKFIYLD